VFPSDSLVPEDDPSLLFTGAGMNQFKPYFLGLKKDVKRATSSQKCLRTADLDCVGKTAYHHTFFEMLGNFSFGDYFKEEAIAWGWEFVTKALKLSPSKLWVSVYEKDDEAFQLWKTKVGIPESRIVRMDAVDNFWPSNAQKDGPNGPCGPCSEIYVGETTGKGVEIWNLVFTQFDRQSDGTLKNLPQRNIDTGMGLERTASVLQGVESNFDTDNFKKIRSELKGLMSSGENTVQENAAMDHARAAIFAIADGALPSNEGRGYVVRKLIRLGSDHLEKAGSLRVHRSFFRLVPIIVDIYGSVYPEISQRKQTIASIIENEEKAYEESCKRAENTRQAAMTADEYAFMLYDTFGLPMDKIKDKFLKDGLPFNEAKFSEYMDEQRERSRQSTKIAGEIFGKKGSYHLIEGLSNTVFLGYEKTKYQCRLLRAAKGDSVVNELKACEEGLLLFDRTPFYAESGGQVGDTGTISGNGLMAKVLDTQWIEKCVAHKVKIESGHAETGKTYELAIDSERRTDIMKNHTATHLLHAALRKVLGDHVKQSGSLVAPDRLRFDFTHFKALDTQSIGSVEELINTEIRKNITLDKKVMPKEKAMEAGAIAFFGEKYGEEVRVVSIGDFSKELCGGTHLRSTGEIELFKIVSESSIQAGVRRLEAITGRYAAEMIKRDEKELKSIADEFNIQHETNIPVELKAIKNRVESLKNKALNLAADQLAEASKKKIEEAKEVKGIKCWDLALAGADVDLIKKNLSVLDSEHYSSAGFVYATFLGQPKYYIMGSGDSVQRGLNCNEIIKNVNQIIKGNGGGKPNFAVGGLKEPPTTPEQIEAIVNTGTANIISFIKGI